MKFSDFEKNEVKKFLNEATRKENIIPLDLFQKAQVFNFLNSFDTDLNPKLDGSSTEVVVEEKTPPIEKIITNEIIKKETIKEEISEQKIQEIIESIKSEIKVPTIIEKDEKSLDLDKILKILKTDDEFIEKISSKLEWQGSPIGGGLGEGDVQNLIDSSPKMFDKEKQGTWRIRQDEEHLRFEYFDGGVWMEQGEFFVTNEAQDGMLMTEDGNPIISEDNIIVVEE